MAAYRDWLEANAPTGRDWTLLDALAHRLRSISGLGSYLFDLDAAAAPHEENRQRIAYARVLGPLLASYPSEGIELSWPELHGSKERRLSSYLKSAVAAEVILLARPISVDRAARLPEADLRMGVGDFPDGP